MRDLNSIYTHLLSIGLINTRDMLREERWLEAKLEMDHLYVIPQLLESSSAIQHRFYLDKVKAKFVDDAFSLGLGGLIQHIQKHYIPIWSELESLVDHHFEHAKCNNQ